ncbi:glycosyltransferase involved in cell wall biosynthesis [Flavobacterium sp. 270]|uniref:glycosyltransferase family 2 protein n=1 Tax=Flavobacterium sp. 270 TaxID=2512114 RepID=UPI00106641D6|nr:glycosyltransferase family 2 protein [Flavobacterium sp. 270]TDW48587.1 glycosyltransferase involved in cell wall biosynthesis [Flavobacterium sp. 270]
MLTYCDAQPLISVLIPTFNVENFVEEAIRSIMDQTYKNLEIIIVDDCSTDNTYAILLNLASIDKRIRLFRNIENKKIVDTLNFAISQAKGEYYARMDGDDISLPERIEKQYFFLLNNPEIDLVGLNVIMINENGKVIQEEKYLEKHKDIVRASKYVSPILHIWLARKNVYDKLIKYRVPTVEDYDFILRSIDNGFVLANLQSSLYLQRIRNGNTITSSGLIQYKSIHYIKKLSLERIINGNIDSHSEENYNKLITVSSLSLFFYKLSSFFHMKYLEIKQKYIYLALFFRLISILLSPKLQFSQIILRKKYKQLFFNLS